VPESSAQSAPSFVAALTSDETDAKAILSLEHPLYSQRKESWQTLIDAYEASGGFLDGSYLWAYPREEVNGYTARQKQARYHNYTEALIDLYTRFLWTDGVKRESSSDEYNQWLSDVDGAGTDIDSLLKQMVSFALAAGHSGVLIDKTADEPADQTMAGERARVVASVFNAVSIPDWRYANNELIAVKLLEASPPTGITEEHPDASTQFLLWDAEGFARFDAEGHLLSAGVPGLGRVPFVAYRPRPSYVDPMLGRGLISNANVVKAIFNRCSEEDEVMRAQAFSLLTVEVPNDADLGEARAAVGIVGASKGLVVRGKVKYETPDQNVPKSIRENTSFLIRELYRAAGVRFAKDGLAAESGESIRLQFSELNENLQGVAKTLADVERRGRGRLRGREPCRGVPVRVLPRRTRR
jgi:hypothetical protein